MEFQIRKNASPITMGELNKEAAAFWGVEIGDKYVAPQGRAWPEDWHHYIGATIAQMPQGKYEWSDIIGKLCGIAAIGETQYDSIICCINFYKPYIELCLHWKMQGYVPVSC